MDELRSSASMNLNALATAPTLEHYVRKLAEEPWRSVRLDPIAYAWQICNPGAPFPAVLRRGLTAVHYSHKLPTG